MKLLNKTELVEWIYQINESEFCLKRFSHFPVSLIDFDWKNELERLASIYKEIDKQDITFHNVRMLFKSVGTTKKINQPLVGLYVNKNINIHPGGSRIMVAKYLDIPFVPLDLIIEKDNLQFDLYQHQLIKNEKQFIQPFENINSDMQIVFNRDESYGSKFSYQPIYKQQFHWDNCESITDFIERTQDTSCDFLMDYYFL